MCVQCVMGAAAGFGVFQAYRYVIKDHARKMLGVRPSSPSTEPQSGRTPFNLDRQPASEATDTAQAAAL